LDGQCPWVNKNAKEIKNFLKEQGQNITLGYTQSYVSLNIDGKISYWLNKRTKPTSTLCFSMKDEQKAEEIKKFLKANEFVFTFNRYKNFLLNIDMKTIKVHGKLLTEIHNIKFKKVAEGE
jgi:hypothetical protein